MAVLQEGKEPALGENHFTGLKFQVTRLAFGLEGAGQGLLLGDLYTQRWVTAPEPGRGTWGALKPTPVTPGQQSRLPGGPGLGGAQKAPSCLGCSGGIDNR